MYSVIFVNDIVLTEGCIYIVPYQWESEHILNVFCHSGNIRKAINVLNSKCFIQVQRLPKFWERERGKKKLPMEVHLWIVMGKHCKFCTTETRMFCKLIYQSFMPSAFLLLYFKLLIFFWQFLVLGFAEEPFLLRCIMYVLHEAICHKTFKGNTVFVVYFKS